MELSQLEKEIIRIANEHAGADNALPNPEVLKELHSLGFEICDRHLRETVKELRYKTGLLIVCMPKLSRFKSHGLTILSPREFCYYRNHYSAVTLSRHKQEKRDREIHEKAMREDQTSIYDYVPVDAYAKEQLHEERGD